MVATRIQPMHEIIRRTFGIAAMLVALPVSALYEDFERESVSAWRASSIGATGTNGVLPNNGSRMAFVKSVGPNRSSLSIDFPYSAKGSLSFEMQANSVPDFVYHAGAGVTISFLSAFNVTLGSVAFLNVTTPDPMPANTLRVDERQHTYSASMGEFASLAKVSTGSAIAKVSVSFGSWGEFRSTTGTVWFDNVAVSSQDAAIDCLFAWAEQLYSSAVAPAGAQTKFFSPYSYRYYAATDSYVGVSVKDDHVYYLDSARNLRDLGELGTWLTTANCRASQ